MARATLAVSVAAVLAVATACGGTPRATTAELAAPQPTPDPTLDAVVRNLPRVLAGAPPTPAALPVPSPTPPRPRKPTVAPATPRTPVTRSVATPTARPHP